MSATRGVSKRPFFFLVDGVLGSGESPSSATPYGMLRDPGPLLREGRKWAQMWTRADNLMTFAGVVMCVVIGLFLATSARADYTQARGIFCDTAEQIEAFVTLVEGETPKQEAMQLINDAAGKDNACVVGHIVFER